MCARFIGVIPGFWCIVNCVFAPTQNGTLQRGCEIVPSTSSQSIASISPLPDIGPGPDPSTIDDEEAEIEENESLPVCRQSQQWHEAAYIVSIKEKHTLAQVAVDEILSTTSLFVADILSGFMDDIRDSTPANTMRILGRKVENINNTLFRGVSTAHLQKQYFKKHFGLLVSDYLFQIE